MEVGYGEEINEVFKYIKNSEVITVFFPKLGRSLVMDLRTTSASGPMIKIMPMTNSISERIETIKNLRPSFPKAKEIVVVPWVGYVQVLKSSGLWKHLLDEIVKLKNQTAINDVIKAYKELVFIQEEDLLEMLFGDKYETIWESQNSKK